MTAKELINHWVDCFNEKDAEGLASLYHEEAINHQVNADPIIGRENIKKMFASEFQRAEMVCIIEQILSDGEWAILEWKDPLGLRGCGFFQIQNDLIVFQRGYWDLLAFLRQHKLPLPTS